MKTIKLICALFCLSFNCLAQAPSIQWQKSLGGTDDEQANSVYPTTDGGFIVTGYSNSADGDVTLNHGLGDCWLVKTDAEGAIQWQKSYGGSGFDFATCVIQTTEGGYLFTGSSGAADGDITTCNGTIDAWIVKTDNAGTIEWQRSYGGSEEERMHSVKQTPDGGYILAGYTFSTDSDSLLTQERPDCWVIKTDNSGNIEWQKKYGGEEWDLANYLELTTDGGYIMCGYTISTGGDIMNGSIGGGDYWIVKLTSSGNIEWQKCYGGTDSDEAVMIKQTTDGGYIVGGSSYSHDGDISFHYGGHDYWVFKLDNTGTIQWEESYGGQEQDKLSSILQTPDGGYLISGFAFSNDWDVSGNHGGQWNGSADYWILKINSTGAIQWQKCFGGTIHEYANSLERTYDGGIIVAGYSNSNDVDVSNHHGNQFTNDVWLVKLSGTADINDTDINTHFIIYPNPSSDIINLETPVINGTYQLQDITGKTLLQGTVSTPKFNLDISALSSGVYFITVSDSEKRMTGKVMKE